MPYKLSIVTDVRSWLKGTADIEKSLDDLADSLDDLATDTKQNSGKAADSLQREFKDAFDKVRTDSKRTGRAVGDDLKDGGKRAGEGMRDLKDEARSSAREAAASFDGSAESITDMIQEITANALPALGPAAGAAGLAAAAGLGILISSLQAAKEKADESVDTVHTMASAMREAGGLAANIAESMADIVDTKEWFEFWQSIPVDRLGAWSTSVRDLGLAYDEVYKAASGDLDALARVQEQSGRRMTDANMDATTTFLMSLKAQGQAVRDARTWNEEYAKSTVGAQERAAEAAADASKSFSDSLTDHLSVADDGLKDFVKKGKLSIAEWAKELQERAKETKAVEGFAVTIAPKLSDEALENFAKLPIETQAQIAKAYRDGGKKDKKTIVANLEAEAKVKTVTIDTSGAQTKANSRPIEVPTTINPSGLITGTTKAADSAQRTANREDNHIEFKTKVDVDELQRQVNRAAASITPPTITVRTKTRKEVP